VWDYAGDGYVHRLIQNRADGKLVELPSAAMSSSPREGGLGPGPSDSLTAEKIEAIGIEYSYLLTSQLDSQRSYYEEKSAELKSQTVELKTMVDSLTKELEHAKTSLRENEQTWRTEREAALSEAEKDRTRAEKRAEKMTDVARRLEKELREERAVSAGLMQNLENLKEKTMASNKERDEFNTRIKDLEDQLRDVMFFLQARDKIENAEGPVAEAQGGSLQIPSPPPVSKSAKKKSSKK
jgi:BRCA1-associated protein